jgi:hypothetical protein
VLERFLSVRSGAETGRWTDWYRGDKKVKVKTLLDLTRKTRRRATTPPEKQRWE